MHGHECADAGVGAGNVLIQGRSADTVHLHINSAGVAFLIADPNFRLLVGQGFLILTDGQKLVDDVLHLALRIAFHQVVHPLLGVALGENVCRGVESHIVDIEQLGDVAHLGAVAGMERMGALCGVGISQLLCLVDRHAAFHQLLHVVTAEQLTDVRIHDAAGMVLCNAVEAELLCEHQHGVVHIDAGENLLDFLAVIVDDTGIFRHKIQPDQVEHGLIHFFYSHGCFLLSF